MDEGADSPVCLQEHGRPPVGDLDCLAFHAFLGRVRILLTRARATVISDTSAQEGSSECSRRSPWIVPSVDSTRA